MIKQFLLTVVALIVSINSFAENQTHVNTNLNVLAGDNGQSFIDTKLSKSKERIDNPEKRSAEGRKRKGNAKSPQKPGEGSSTGCNGGSRANGPANTKIGAHTRTGFQGKNSRPNIRSNTRINIGLQNF